MVEDKELMQGEELSRYLDQLNDGNCPLITDQEIEELIETAAVVQQSYTQNEVPRLLIDEMVTTLATELGQEKRKQHARWLYGGLACAATVLLVIGTQFLVPHSFEQNIAQEIDGSSKMEKVVAVADQGNIPTSQPSTSISIAPVKESSPGAGDATPQPPRNLVDSVSKVVEEITEVAQTIPKEEKTNQVAILAKEVPQEKAMGQNLRMSKMKMDDSQDFVAIKQTNIEKVIVVQPNKVAQSITVDPSSGTIRQVYGEGVDGTVIITQRMSNEDKSLASAKQIEDKKAPNNFSGPQVMYVTENNHNSLTVKFEKYSITVEGNKTIAELQKIVDSLVAKKIEE